MITEAAVWAIFLLPLACFVVISLFIRPFFDQYRNFSGYLTIMAIGTGFILSLWAMKSVVDNHGPIEWAKHEWISMGDLSISIGIIMDPLTAVMLIVVSGVSLAVQVYSQGYMNGDNSYSRYFAYMSLFTASMLGLVLSSNIIQLYAFWELVGLSSYLLIGFWYQRPAAAAAAKKAFLVTRLGDVGFMLAILYLFFHANTLAAQEITGGAFDIDSINQAAKSGLLGVGVVTWIAMGIFAGAIGKSAQFPLHVWLPDAMEGPTPVSALIHAATMVVAGVFLVARFFPLFEASPTAMTIVALIGGFTAIFAATMGLVMNDIKRVLAYSTVSQLGYMMLALGLGAYEAAIFHLFNHAFFKALLFLGSGSVNHASGTFDMRYMGGLKKYMPWTYATFLIGALSIAGIFPLSGFWSKDEILTGALNADGAVSNLLLGMAIVAAFMTSFYIFRALFLTFHGEFKGGIDAETGSQTDAHSVHLSESPAVMIVPMGCLAILSIVSGFIANPLAPIWGLGIVPVHWFSHMLDGVALVSVHAAEFNIVIAALSTIVASSGIGLAYLMYCRKSVDPERIGEALKPLYVAASRKFYFDELYEDYLTRKWFYKVIAGGADWVDRNIVDKAGIMVGFIGRNLGGVIGGLESGQIQAYGTGMSMGLIMIVIGFMIWA